LIVHEQQEHAMTKKSHDHLKTTTDQAKIELVEKELSRVTGGTANKGGKKPVEHITIDLNELIII
jgi:hypothetical protein